MKFSVVFLVLSTTLGVGSAETSLAQDCNDSRQVGAIAGCTQVIERMGIGTDYKSKAFLNRGNAYQAIGDLADAIADYDQAIRLNPQFALAFNNRGVARRSQGALSRAVSDFGEAIRLEPKYAMALYNRGLAYLKLGETERAIRDYDNAVRIDPQYCDGFYAQYRGGQTTRQYLDAEFNTQ